MLKYFIWIYFFPNVSFFHSQMTLSIASWQPTFPSTTQSKHAFCLWQQTGSSQELFEHRRTRWGGCTSHAGHPELLQAPYRGIKPRSNYRLPTGTEEHFSTALLHNCDSHNACIHLNAATKGRGHHSDHSHLPGDWRRWVLDIAKSKPSNKLLGMAEVGQASKGVGWPFTGSPEILH